MTAISKRRIPRQAPSMPWMLRPRFIVAANVVCLAVNIWAGTAESGRYDHFVNICATVDNPTNFGTVGMSGPVAGAVIAILIVAGLSILATIAWCLRKRSYESRPGRVIGTALFLIGFALLNVLLAYVLDLRYLTYHVMCPGGV